MDKLLELVTDPIKAFIATISGTFIGYTPNIQATLLGMDPSLVDKGFQHIVWTTTIIVAIFAIISAVQKQIDRYRINRRPRKDIFDKFQDDED